MYICFLLSFLLCAFGQSNKGIRLLSETEVALLDPTTGIVSCKAPLRLPKSVCHWEFGMGTRGQTSAIFFLNQSYFFTAQEVCQKGYGKTSLFEAMGPHCWANDPPSYELYHLAELNLTRNLMESYMAWDHTCNIVVISPDKSTGGVETFITDQVSEYDSQQRIQPPTSQQSRDCDDCWRRVIGTGALDFGNFRGSWIPGQEWNCGDECLFYTLQEHVVKGVQTGERKLVGTYFRTGKVGLEIEDTVNVQSLSWNPFTMWHHRNQFLGIGFCNCEYNCRVSECQNTYGNNFLFAFNPKSSTNPANFTYLADIGNMDPMTSHLGVEYSPAPFSKAPFHAYVFHNNRVVTFDLKVDDNGVVSAAQKLNVSPPVEWHTIIMWANAGMS